MTKFKRRIGRKLRRHQPIIELEVALGTISQSTLNRHGYSHLNRNKLHEELRSVLKEINTAIPWNPAEEFGFGGRE